MKRLAVFLAVVIALLLAGVYLVLWLTAPAHHVNKASFARIEIGMSANQVRAILGAPPGDYSSDPVPDTPEDFVREVWKDEVRFSSKTWVCDDGMMFLYFSGDGLLTSKKMLGPGRERSLLAKVRRWLGF